MEHDLPRKNLLKIFVDRPKLVLNALNQGEFKIKIEIIMRINDGINVSLLFIANPINFNCRDFKCKDTVVSLYDLVGGNLEVKLTGNKTYLGLPNRTLGDFILLRIPEMFHTKNVFVICKPKTQLIIHLRRCEDTFMATIDGHFHDVLYTSLDPFLMYM